jgi:acetate kinase
VRKYIGAYFAELGGADAVVFSGGIGENSAAIRSRICRGLGALGLELDETRNARDGGARLISNDASRLQAWVIPTDEELLIARDTARLLSASPPETGPVGP